MQSIIQLLKSEAIFWAAWILIPLCMEILPAIFGSLILIVKRLRKKKSEPIQFYPLITMIVPVYNSSGTLEACMDSIEKSTYPSNKIKIFLVDNGSSDNSFQIFQNYQESHSALTCYWMNAKQGKSKALNMALFHSDGKYILHIDSDGLLHPDAIMNVVTRFEQDDDVHCMTGAIMSNYEMIRETKKRSLRILQKMEFCEYAQAFLAGRNFASVFDNIFTLSGAFSAFRKSTILKTQLYNTDTVCEDAHVTFQVRTLLNKRIDICENAIFFVDPIESYEKLYTQRQRWQRGELEVAHMFPEGKSRKVGFFTRQLMFDHTFAFPRMIWYFALIYLIFQDYPFRLIGISLALIYILYVVSNTFFYINICSFIKDKELKKYYRRQYLYVWLLPYFNFIVFWFRFAGIINAIRTNSAWKTLTMREELAICKEIIHKDVVKFKPIYKKIYNMMYKS